MHFLLWSAVSLHTKAVLLQRILKDTAYGTYQFVLLSSTHRC